MSEHRPWVQWRDGAAGPALRAVVDWRTAAACATSPALFFGPDGETAAARDRRERKAKAVCAVCPVRAECRNLFHAVGAQDGVWGGLGEYDRGRSYAGGRSHRSRAEQQRLEAIREAGERPCSGPCGLTKPLEAFPRHGGRCRDCLSEQLTESNRRRWGTREQAA